MLTKIQSRNRTRWLFALVGITTIVVSAACGGSDNAAGPSGTSGGDDKEQITQDGVIANAPASGEAGAPPATDSDSYTYDGDRALQSTGGGGSAGPLPALLDRQIIRTATISIETDAVSQRFEDIGTIATGAGGFVASSSFGTDEDRQIASITVRVPGDRYQDVLNQLRKVGEVKSEQSSANDVTEEYTDLESRLRNLQASEQRYLDLLSRAVNIDEILTVQDRINATRAEIEQVQGRINLLGNQTELATITAHLAPPIAGLVTEEQATNSPLEVAQEAFEASLAVLLGVAVVAIAVLAFSWWIVPLAGLGWYLGRRHLQNERARNTAPPTA